MILYLCQVECQRSSPRSSNGDWRLVMQRIRGAHTAFSSSIHLRLPRSSLLSIIIAPVGRFFHACMHIPILHSLSETSAKPIFLLIRVVAGMRWSSYLGSKKQSMKHPWWNSTDGSLALLVPRRDGHERPRLPAKKARAAGLLRRIPLRRVVQP